MTRSIETRSRLYPSCFLLLLMVASCSDQPAKPAAQTTPASAPPSVKTVVASMKVLDMDGNPVPGILPIATKQPNAFDAPVAKGELTDASGQTSITIPSDQWLFVRAWDPAKKLFANNFYEILPGETLPNEQLQIVMLPAAALELEVMANDGGIIPDQFVGMMMSHPTRGPWWPSETTTDSNGRARFEQVPPGEYIITVELRDGRHTDLPATILLPGQSKNVGPVILR